MTKASKTARASATKTVSGSTTGSTAVSKPVVSGPADEGAKPEVTVDDIPETTAPVVADDVTKVAVVNAGYSEVDRKATAEQIQFEKARLDAKAKVNPDTRLVDSGLVFIDDPATNQHYVAETPEGQTSIHGSPVRQLQISPLALRHPEPGLAIYPAGGGEPFVVQDGVREWFDINTPAGEPLF